MSVNKQTVFSQEGTTQDEIFAVPMNEIANIHLLKFFHQNSNWFADSCKAVGSLDNLKKKPLVR